MPKIFIRTLDAPPSGIAVGDLFILNDINDASYPAGVGKTVKISVADLASALGITGAGLFGASSSILARLAQLESDVSALESDVSTLYATKASTGHSHP